MLEISSVNGELLPVTVAIHGRLAGTGCEVMLASRREIGAAAVGGRDGRDGTPAARAGGDTAGVARHVGVTEDR
jgi:hypothetical protein